MAHPRTAGDVDTDDAVEAQTGVRSQRPWCAAWLCGTDRTSRQVALGWMLSPEERKVMDAQAAVLARQLVAKYP